MSDRRSAPHVARNAGPIADLLREVLPEGGLVLEVASGTGEHAVHFAREFPRLLFQPSDPDPAALRSIEAWRAEAGLFNLLPPISLDVRAREWPVESAEAVLCINMIHISPWTATAGLMCGAGRILPPGGPLIVYGPFRRAEVPTAPSNEAFDASRVRAPYRDLLDRLPDGLDTLVGDRGYRPLVVFEDVDLKHRVLRHVGLEEDAPGALRPPRTAGDLLEKLDCALTVTPTDRGVELPQHVVVEARHPLRLALPPAEEFFSCTCTSCPAADKYAAALKPENPAPITMIFAKRLCL